MIASQDDVDAWDADETDECCDEEFFLPSLEDSVKSPYNQSCARIFEASFKAEHPYWADYNYDVRKAFTTHLDYLKKMHKKMISSNTGMEEAAQDKSKRRRRERKYQVSALPSVSLHFLTFRAALSAPLPYRWQDPERQWMGCQIHYLSLKASWDEL